MHTTEIGFSLTALNYYDFLEDWKFAFSCFEKNCLCSIFIEAINLIKIASSEFFIDFLLKSNAINDIFIISQKPNHPYVIVLAAKLLSNLCSFESVTNQIYSPEVIDLLLNLINDPADFHNSIFQECLSENSCFCEMDLSQVYLIRKHLLNSLESYVQSSNIDEKMLTMFFFHSSQWIYLFPHSNFFGDSVKFLTQLVLLFPDFFSDKVQDLMSIFSLSLKS